MVYFTDTEGYWVKLFYIKPFGGNKYRKLFLCSGAAEQQVLQKVDILHCYFLNLGQLCSYCPSLSGQAYFLIELKVLLHSMLQSFVTVQEKARYQPTVPCSPPWGRRIRSPSFDVRFMDCNGAQLQPVTIIRIISKSNCLLDVINEEETPRRQNQNMLELVGKFLYFMIVSYFINLLFLAHLQQRSSKNL